MHIGVAAFIEVDHGGCHLPRPLCAGCIVQVDQRLVIGNGPLEDGEILADQQRIKSIWQGIRHQWSRTARAEAS